LSADESGVVNWLDITPKCTHSLLKMQALKAMTTLIWHNRKLKLIVCTSTCLHQETAGVNDTCTYNYSKKTITEIELTMAEKGKEEIART
jgi:hypothetical protein